MGMWVKWNAWKGEDMRSRRGGVIMVLEEGWLEWDWVRRDGHHRPQAKPVLVYIYMLATLLLSN